MKKVGKYVIISFLLLLGLACVGVLYLFFVPNSNLFTITYISNNQKYFSEEFDSSAVSSIILSSDSYDVKVSKSESEEIQVVVYDNSFGFTLTKYKKATISSSLKDNILTFNILEPKGATLDNSSYVELKIPNLESGINLSLKNNKAPTEINAEINLNSLSYSTENGDISISACSLLGNLEFNLNKADLTMHESVKTNENAVSLRLTTGSFKAEQSVLGDVTIKSNERGVVLLNECHNLKEEIAEAGGRIEAKKVFNVKISTSDTNVYIKTITGGASIKLTTGDIEIDELTGYSALTTTSGSITVKKANSNLLLESVDGDITVSNAFKTTTANTDNGNINIYFDETAEAYNPSSTDIKSRELISTINNNGKLTASGVDHAEINLKNNGRLDLTFRDVLGANTIAGRNGEVFVKVDTTDSYKLTTKSDAGSVRVNLAQISEHGGYKTKEIKTTNVNGCPDNTKNTLVITTVDGNLTVLDSLFY